MLLTPTPDPTTTELLGLDPLVNGDLSGAWVEIVRRLQTNLGAYITAKNEARGWANTDGEMRVPDHIEVAPLDLAQVKVNCVLVAMQVSTSSEGIGAFRNVCDVRVWSLDKRASTGDQILAHTRRAECIRTVLLPFLRGCVDESGINRWRTVEPTGFQVLPERKEFSGVAATFRLVQSPNLGFSD